jgi:branched-chain amino acid transport system ATP-binding protein
MAPTSSDQAAPDTAAVPGRPPVLRLTDLRVRLGSTVALASLSLAVEPGQVVSVVGPTGAGKSTVFNALCGFVPPESGEITWRGAALRPRPHRLTTLGVARTLQGVGLYGGLTVLENVLVGSAGVPRVPAIPPGRRAGAAAALLGAVRHRLQGAELRNLALDHLTQLGVVEYATADLAAVPVALHGRVVLARALLAEPELLVLDDPTVGLEPSGIVALAALMRALPARAGNSVLLTTADAEFARAASDRVVTLDRGAVVTAEDSERTN